MRQIQIVVPDEKAQELLELLEQYEETPLHISATGPFDTVIAQVDDEKVDELVEVLKRMGIEERGSITILPPSVRLRREEAGTPKKGIAPSVELVSLAKDASELGRSFYFMTIVSAFVATLGLLLDSTAVVIGAMVIAPLLGPAISVCVGTVLGEGRLFRDAIASMAIGLALAIAVSTVTAWATVNFGLIPPLLDLGAGLPKEILERTDLNVVNVGLALASGAAGAYSFAERKGEILMGVMIAVALMPPACVVGIGIALLDGQAVMGSVLLLLVNVICINIAGTLVLWKIGVRPWAIFKEVESARKVKKRLATTAVILIVLSSFFAYTTYEAYSEYRFKEDVGDEIGAIVGGLENVSGYEIRTIDVEGSQVDVSLVVFSGGEGCGPGIAEAIRAGLAQRFGGYDFSVGVVTEVHESAG